MNEDELMAAMGRLYINNLLLQKQARQMSTRIRELTEQVEAPQPDPAANLDGPVSGEDGER